MSISRDCTQASFAQAHQTLGELNEAVTSERNANQKAKGGLLGSFIRFITRRPPPKCSRDSLNKAMAFLHSYEAHTKKIGSRTLKKISIASDAAHRSQQDVSSAASNGYLHNGKTQSTKGVQKAIEAIQKDLKSESESFDKASKILAKMDPDEDELEDLEENIKSVVKIAKNSKVGEVKFISSLPKEHIRKLAELFSESDTNHILDLSKAAFLKAIVKQCPAKLQATPSLMKHLQDKSVVEDMNLSDRLKSTVLEHAARGGERFCLEHARDSYRAVQENLEGLGLKEKLDGLESSITTFLHGTSDEDSHNMQKSFESLIIARALKDPQSCKAFLGKIGDLISHTPDSPQKNTMKEILVSAKKIIIDAKMLDDFSEQTIPISKGTFKEKVPVLAKTMKETGMSLQEIWDLSPQDARANIRQALSSYFSIGRRLESDLHKPDLADQKMVLKEALVMAESIDSPKQLFQDHEHENFLLLMFMPSSEGKGGSLNLLDDSGISDIQKLQVLKRIEGMLDQKTEYSSKLPPPSLDRIRAEVNRYKKGSDLFNKDLLMAKLDSGHALTKGQLIVVDSLIKGGDADLLKKVIAVSDSQSKIKNSTDLTESLYEAISSNEGQGEQAQLKAIVEVMSTRMKDGLVSVYSIECKQHISKLLMKKGIRGDQALKFQKQFDKLFPQACRISHKLVEQGSGLAKELYSAGERFTTRQVQKQMDASQKDYSDEDLVVAKAKALDAYKSGSTSDPEIRLDQSLSKKQLIAQLNEAYPKEVLGEVIAKADFENMSDENFNFYLDIMKNKGIALDEPLAPHDQTILNLVARSGHLKRTETLLNAVSQKVEVGEARFFTEDIKSLVLNESLNPATDLLRQHAIKQDIDLYMDHINSIVGDIVEMKEASPALDLLPEAKKNEVTSDLNRIKGEFESLKERLESESISLGDYKLAITQLQKDLASNLNLIQQRADLEFGLDGKGFLLPKEPAHLFSASFYSHSKSKLQEPNSAFEIPDAPSGFKLSQMEELLKLAEYQMPETIIDEGFPRPTADIIATYQNALKMGQIQDHYNRVWSNDLKELFTKVNLHYVAKMDSKIKAMEKEKDPKKKEALKADLASEIRGFVLDRIGGGFLHCTNRMNGELRNAYLQLVAQDQSGDDSPDAQVDILLLNTRRQLFEDLAREIDPPDLASFIHHQERKLGKELGLGIDESSVSDNNYSNFGGRIGDRGRMRERFYERYPKMVLSSVRDKLNTPGSKLTEEGIYNWYKERYNAEDISEFFSDGSGHISDEALRHFLVQIGHLEQSFGGDDQGISAKQNFVSVLLKTKDLNAFERALSSPNFDVNDIPDSEIPHIKELLRENPSFLTAMQEFIAQNKSERAKDLQAFMIKVSS